MTMIPLPENYHNVTNEECVYEDWGHTGVCHRRQIVAMNQKPSLKVRYNEKLNRVETFELMFMKDYLKDVIVSNINKTIEGHIVTYGEYLRWLGLVPGVNGYRSFAWRFFFTSSY